jgi:ankyrin repeat protein
VSINQRKESRAAVGEQGVLQYDLCMAASKGDLQKVRSLLDDGADPNIGDYDLRTALHVACSDGHLEVVQALVDAGGSVLLEDRWCSTPYADASRYGHGHIVAFLQEFLAAHGQQPPQLVPPQALTQALSGYAVSAVAFEPGLPSVSPTLTAQVMAESIRPRNVRGSLAS